MALKTLGYEVEQPQDDKYGGHVKLRKTMSPHATIWEHRDVTRAY